MPYPVFEGVCRVHSFFRNMWHGMRSEVFRAIGVRVERMREKGKVSESVVVTVFSQGEGWVCTYLPGWQKRVISATY